MTEETITNSSQLDKKFPIRTLAGVPLVIIMDEDNVKESDLYKASTQLSKRIPIRAIDNVPLVIPLGMEGGWLEVYETWTYASADDPTFTFTIAAFDATTKYSAGMRIKLTQTTVKYFIVTKVVFDDPGSTITVYGGTDYDLVNATITSPCYSTQKAPHGFPLTPTKWQVKATLTSDAEQLSPTQYTWYNLSSFSLTVPIGAWRLFYEVTARLADISSQGSIVATLSKVNNAKDDDDFTMGNLLAFGGSTSAEIYANFVREKAVLVSSKTIYYLLCSTRNSGVDSIRFLGGANYGNAVVCAICAYL